MSLEIVRRIRGNVHGSIDVTALEDAVIEHSLFQRLRRVKQLAFLHLVFPGATHTRFEHSLGVMHLAGVAFQKLQSNQARLCISLSRYEDFEQKEKQPEKDGKLIHGLLAPTFPMIEKVFESDYILQVVRLAGLLHDLGHPPFSHSGERFLPTWDEVIADNKDLPDYLRRYLESYRDLLVQRGKDLKKERVRHEIMSILLIDKVLRDTYLEYPDISLKVDPRDVVAIVIPAVEPDPASPLLKSHAFELCHELISGELDIDRMDYLLRDSRECGVVYGIFDAGRILDSLCVYFDPNDNRLHIAITYSGLAAFEDYLRARYSMYLQLYYHKSSVAVEAMMQHMGSMIPQWRLPSNVNEYGDFDEHNIGAEILAYARQKLDADKFGRLKSILNDILHNRRLWKRVYEAAGKNVSSETDLHISKAAEFLKGEGLSFEQLSSASSLTRFQPRAEHEHSQNYLRLVKKDVRQLYRVYPIEDYSGLIAANDMTIIHRIYVESGKDSEGKDIPTSVKNKLTNLLYT